MDIFVQIRPKADKCEKEKIKQTWKNDTLYDS